MQDFFANNATLISLAVALIIAQSLWWWRLLKKTPIEHSSNTHWVLYASQSGQAQQLAEQTATRLSTDEKRWQVVSLADWQGGVKSSNLSTLNGLTVLFVVSTQGEGDPPDNGTAFWRKLRADQGDLSRLTFAVLGLGDSRYTPFCGFADSLQQQLKQRGASPLFNGINVDNLNVDDVDVWWQQLAQHFELTDNLPHARHLPKPQTVVATLIEKHGENIGSPVMPLFSLQFHLSSIITWQGGDIADVVIPTDSGEILRQYSIANVGASSEQSDNKQRLSLLVRQVTKNNGELGIGSGYLTDNLNVGESVTLSIRPNPSFYLPNSPTPLIFIATGSGLAGVLSLLQQVERTWGKKPTHHLIYGERYPQYDTPCRGQLTHHQNSGLLHAVDYCFSRQEDNTENTHYRYVQDALVAQTNQLIAKINQGAMVYVCGSKISLANSIPETLKTILGDADYQRLIARNGLRLDVY